MTPKFYIVKQDQHTFEETKHFVEPLEQELKDAQNQMKWGAKKGIISFVTELRTSTIYWEV